MADPGMLGREQRLPAARLPGDPDLQGPFPVGRYAKGLQQFLRERPRLLLIGELTDFKKSRAKVFFELRDSDGAVPCAMWRNEFERLGIPDAALADGAEVVVGGGPDFYPGSSTASPSFSFGATFLRLAGEGDLLARLAELRRRLEADGLFRPQKELARPLIPKTIGVVTARTSAACADLLAGFDRRGWHGTIVWADAPVQNRKAAPAISAALRGLAEVPEVEAIVVCRGGGSLIDLWAFCDENLCRTIALLPVPVISAVGHESDRTLIDDVAAVSCSTPTHAAAAVIQVDIPAAHADLRSHGASMLRGSRAAVRARAQRVASLARVPAHHLGTERRRLHQRLREIRAASARGIAERRAIERTRGLVLSRKAAATERSAAPEAARLARLAAGLRTASDRAVTVRARSGEAARLAIRAHEPARVLERGFALVEDQAGEPVTSAVQARLQAEVRVRFADDAVRATIDPSTESEDE